jgi:predicted aspartyl protease
VQDFQKRGATEETLARRRGHWALAGRVNRQQIDAIY